MLAGGFGAGGQKFVDLQVTAAGFGRALRGHRVQRPKRVVIAEAFAEQAADIDRRDSHHRLDALFGQRRVQDIAATAADADGPDPVRIDIGQRHRIVDDVADILDPLRGIFDPTRLTTRSALIAGIKGDDDEPLLGQRLAIYRAGGLFLATAKGVDADDGRVFLCRIETRRGQDQGGDIPGHVPVTKAHTFHRVLPFMGKRAARTAIGGRADGALKRPDFSERRAPTDRWPR